MQRKDFTSMVIDMIQEHRLSELQQLMSENRQPLPETAVRMGYRLYAERDESFRTRYFLIRKLKEITGIDPEETVVKSLVKEMIGSQPPAVFKLVCQSLGISPTLLRALNRNIQEWYRKLLENAQYPQMSQLQAVTRLAPEESMIQEAYKRYLISGHLISFSGLRKQLGIDPQPDMVQQVYQHFRSALGTNSGTSAGDRENLRRWYAKVQEMTGIPDNAPPSE